MYIIFLLSPTKILFEQYYRLHFLGLTIAVSETKSNSVFVLIHASFDQNNLFFLHGIQEAVKRFHCSSSRFFFFYFQKLAPYDPIKHPTQPNPSTHLQNFQPGLL